MHDDSRNSEIVRLNTKIPWGIYFQTFALLAVGVGIIIERKLILEAVAFLCIWKSIALFRQIGPVISMAVTINRPPDVVWDVVTNSKNFKNIIQGTSSWGPFDRRTAAPGTSIDKDLMDLNWKLHPGKYYVVNWSPPFHFSMGDRPDRWIYSFYLSDSENATRLEVSQRFNVLGLLPFLSRPLVYYTANQVADLCRKASGETSYKMQT